MGRASSRCCLAILLGTLSIHCHLASAEPAIEGYSDYHAYAADVAKLDESPFVTVSSLGKTLFGRDIHLLTIGTGEVDSKPAILIVGNADASQLAGSEIVLRLIRKLVDEAAANESAAKLFDRLTIYAIPRPSPDAAEAFFNKPWRERPGNQRPTDDDRDGEVGEDPAEDMNQDGWITMIRVPDPAGEYMPHPDDPRILIKADPQKNEVGRYSIYVEGTDNDGDEKWNEDGSGGVAFNRNFTFRYPFFSAGAGPNQVSEIETRAVADFAFAHTNIAAVFSFGPEDNLMEPWKPNPGADRGRIKLSVDSADAPWMSYIAQQYQKLSGKKDAPPAQREGGNFAEWAYYHFGRWSFCARGWWIPKVAAPAEQKKDQPKDSSETPAQPNETKPVVEAVPAPTQPTDQTPAKPVVKAVAPADEPKPQTPAESPADAPRPVVEAVKEDSPGADAPASEQPSPAPMPDASTGEDETPAEAGNEEQEKSPPATAASATGDDKPATVQRKEPKDKRSAELLQALEWFAGQQIDGFVDWTPIEHPDFPGNQVEVGGFKPFLLINPPAKELDGLADQHLAFVKKLSELMPHLTIAETKVEPLGTGLFRVSATVVNDGFLPTSSAMGESGRLTNPLQIEIKLPEGASLVTGSPRKQMRRLEGNGGSETHTWLVRGKGTDGEKVVIHAWSPSVGSHEVTVDLK